MEYTLDEALLRLRAEILAPDWRLNERRAVGLLEALVVVEAACQGRRAVLYVSGMIRAAVAYHRARGEGAPAGVLDFGKQALAQLVGLLEDDEPVSGLDAEVFRRLHDQFNRLKVQLVAGRVK